MHTASAIGYVNTHLHIHSSVRSFGQYAQKLTDADLHVIILDSALSCWLSHKSLGNSNIHVVARFYEELTTCDQLNSVSVFVFTFEDTFFYICICWPTVCSELSWSLACMMLVMYVTFCNFWHSFTSVTFSSWRATNFWLSDEHSSLQNNLTYLQAL